jgi:hypothetical protein
MAETLTFTLDNGTGEHADVVIKLRPDLAPAMSRASPNWRAKASMTA